MEKGDYKIYFFCPDFPKPSGGVGLLYDHVRILVEEGFNAIILHQKDGFVPEWLGDRLKGVPVQYIENTKLQLGIEDFVFIPEGVPSLMENLAKNNAPCKRVVFCQNWYYVLNALPPGITWFDYKIDE